MNILLRAERAALVVLALAHLLLRRIDRWLTSGPVPLLPPAATTPLNVAQLRATLRRRGVRQIDGIAIERCRRADLVAAFTVEG
jgi:hypothetical protein